MEKTEAVIIFTDIRGFTKWSGDTEGFLISSSSPEKNKTKRSEKIKIMSSFIQNHIKFSFPRLPCSQSIHPKSNYDYY